MDSFQTGTFPHLAPARGSLRHSLGPPLLAALHCRDHRPAVRHRSGDQVSLPFADLRQSSLKPSTPVFIPRPSLSAVAPPRVAGSVCHWHASMGPRGLAHAAGWCQLGVPFGGQCPGQSGRRLPTHSKCPPWDWGCGAILFPVVNSCAAHSASAASSRTEEPWNQGCTRDVAFY